VTKKQPAENSADQTVDAILATPSETNEEKKRLGEVNVNAEMEKERLVRGETPAAPNVVSEAENKIASLRTSIYNVEVKRKNTEEALAAVEGEHVQASCASN